MWKTKGILVVLAIIPFVFLGGGTLHAATGCAAGYAYTDSNEAFGPTFSFEDISGTGTALNLGDDQASPVALPFAFIFNGVTFTAGTNIYVSSNGHVDFTQDTTCNESWNAFDLGIPSNITSCAFENWGADPLIAPWFSDLDPTAIAGANVYHETRGLAPNRRLLVQWETPPFGTASTPCTDPADMVIFQVLLFESSNDILFQYSDATTSGTCVDSDTPVLAKRESQGGSSTVGLSTTNTSGLQYSANNQVLTDGLAILFKIQQECVLVSPVDGLETTEEGATDTFTVRLTTAPITNVTVGMSSSNTTEGTVDKSSLTFTPVNWNGLQMVTVTGVDDAVADGDQAYTILITNAVSTDLAYSGINPADILATNIDNESPNFIVSSISGDTTEAGGQATFTVRLTKQPTGNVTLPISSSDTGEGTVDKSSLTFTPLNWNADQTVTVTGQDDFIVDPNELYAIVLGPATSFDVNYDGVDPNDVQVINIDDETAGFFVSVISGDTTEAPILPRAPWTRQASPLPIRTGMLTK
jgi:hypothetical protein